MRKKHYRSIFLSDIHLGFHGCKAAELTTWLKKHSCDNLFLLGDIIDVWALKSKFYWPPEHTQLVRALLKMSNNAQQTVYTPGNHDWVFKTNHMEFDSITICNEYVHTAANGNRYLCLHGDKHDGVLASNKLLIMLGCWAYDALLYISTHVSKARAFAGRVHWSLSRYLKRKVKAAVSYTSNYEQTVVADVLQHNVDGVICGHIHHPGILNLSGTIYANCGDWVESLSLIVEHSDGTLEVMHPHGYS
jgi:UDP-2,3-diacylglucosamine pyrophosphatase LpxH